MLFLLVTYLGPCPSSTGLSKAQVSGQPSSDPAFQAAVPMQPQTSQPPPVHLFILREHSIFSVPMASVCVVAA